MDLSGWSQRKVQQIATGSKSLYDFLSEVLEGEAGKQRIFTSRDDFDALERVIDGFASLSPRGVVSESLFEQFLPYFEAGFWLKRGESGQWRPLRMFILGHAFTQAAPDAAADFPMPEMSRLQVMETRGRTVLKRFHLERLVQLRESAAFLHKVTDDDAFLFLTARGRPWAVDRVESANRALARWAGAPPPPAVSTRSRLFL